MRKGEEKEGREGRNRESSPVVTESRVSLDSSLLGKNLVELTLDVAEDLAEASRKESRRSASKARRRSQG